MIVKHGHHIIPKYRGGDKLDSNIVPLSVTQHAMYHFCNWQLWGDERDRLAWRGLAGLIGKEELIRALRREIIKIAQAKRRENGPTQKQSNFARKNLTKYGHLAHTPEALEKRKETFARNGHQQGEKNSAFGTMWITDGTKEGSRRIPKGSPIPEGFRPGRVCHKDQRESSL